MFHPGRTITCALACAVAALSFAPSALAQARSGMSEQMARMGGSASIVDKECAGTSVQQQATSKEKQKTLLVQRGMDAAAFEKAYAAGASDARLKWESMSPAKQAETCRQIEQQVRDAAEQMGK